METKNYSERVNGVKKEIINEMKSLLNTRSSTCYDFKEKFTVHYIEGDVATTETCYCVEIDSEGDFGFYATSGTDFNMDYDDCIEHDKMLLYDTESLIRILEQLKKEIREEKLQTLRELVKNAGGSVSFDGNFTFTGVDARNCGWMETICEETKLMGLSLKDGKIEISDTWDGDDYTNSEDFFETCELDDIIEYVRNQTENTPEELVALTDEQEKLVLNFIQAVDALKDGKVGLIMDDDSRELYALNMEHVESIKSSTYDEVDLQKKIYKITDFVCPVTFNVNFLNWYWYTQDEDILAKFK